MYRNIGEKIKGGAIAFFIILAIGSFIPGLALTISRMEAVGIPLMLGGPVLAWISSWVLYGFGELISKTSEIAYYTKYIAENSAAPKAGAAPVQRAAVPPPAPTVPANLQAKNLLQQGLITQEEYEKIANQAAPKATPAPQSAQKTEFPALHQHTFFPNNSVPPDPKPAPVQKMAEAPRRRSTHMPVGTTLEDLLRQGEITQKEYDQLTNS